MIRQLPDEVKSYIRSGVAITSITQCVEELLLNSIDAGATCVAARVDIDCFKVQVVDNGHGILADELPLIGNRYTTSKCHTVSDLDDLRYFGYRGEALASIKDACGVLEIVTKTKSCPKPLCKLFQDGKALPIKESAIPRPSVGTTITAHALFMNFPVRQKSVNESLELEKIRQRVAGLALMKPHVSVRLRNDSTGTTLIHTKKCSNALVTFASLFGQTKADALVEIKGEKDQFSVDGFIGKEGSTKKDVQFVYVNGRLVLNTKIHKLISQLIKKSVICKRKYGISSVSPTLPDSKNVFRTSPGKQLDKQPMFILNVKCPLTEYDITFDPAKTLVEFKAWNKLLLCITNVINEFLKKEDLFTTSPIQEYVICDEALGDNVQPAATISPSNIRDVLISKTAKRFKPMSKAILKTPEGVPLEKWKAENTSIHKANEDASTSSSELLRGNSSLEQSSLSTNTEILDTDTNREPSSDRNSDSNLLSDSRAEVTGNVNIKGNSCSSLRAVKEKYFENQAVFNMETSLNKPVVPGRSALSSFRKLVGKSSGTVPSALPMRTSIEESLKKISKILPSSSTTSISADDKSEKALSSLQKFRKFASKFEHKVYNSDNQPKKVLPAKFNKINEVPKIKNIATFEDNLVNKPNFSTDSSMTDTNYGSSAIVERTGNDGHDSKSSKTEMKLLESVNTTCHERKRTSSLTNPITSKLMKTTHHCDTEENGAAFYGDQDERKPNNFSIYSKTHSCGTNDQQTCYGPNMSGKTIHQQAFSNPQYIQHLADGEHKSSAPNTKNYLRSGENTRDNYCQNGLTIKQGGADIAADDKISSFSGRTMGMPCESLKTIQGAKRLDDRLDSDKGPELVKECHDTRLPMPLENSMTRFGDPGLVVENSQSNVRGSQLFKHLPYSEIHDAQKVDICTVNRLTDFPMDTKKASQDNTPADVVTFTEVPIGTHTHKLTLNTTIGDSYDTFTGVALKTNEPIPENDVDDSVETYTAIPLHKAKFIEDIIVAGVDIQNNAVCEYSSQKYIPDSLFDVRETVEETPTQNKDIQIDTDPETRVNIGTVDITVFDSTQEFIPCTTTEDHVEGDSMMSQSLVDNKSSTAEANSKEGDDTMSPSSTGFTPQLDNYTGPTDTNETVSETTTCSIEEAVDEKCVPNMAKFSESSYVGQHESSNEMNTTECNDVSQMSQDTLDMPSILESSRLDKSDIEIAELVLSDYWHVKKDHLDTVTTKSRYEPHQHYSEWQDKDTDDITITQLLASTTCIKTSESIEKCETNVNVLTFRDFFTPTPTQQTGTDLYHHNDVLACQNGEEMINSTVKDLAQSRGTAEDLFTATCDNEDTHMADDTDTFGMVDEDIVMASDIAAGQKSDIKKVETCHQRSRDQSETECEADETVDDNNWIEMKHPATGKKMFVHAKLGSVRDSLDMMSKEQTNQTDQSIITTPKKALSTQMRTSVKPKSQKQGWSHHHHHHHHLSYRKCYVNT